MDAQKYYSQTMVKNLLMIFWHMSVKNLTEQHFTSLYTLRSNGKTENFNKFLKASIRKMCQEDKEAWDQVLPQILFAYRCCPHTSTGAIFIHFGPW